MITALPNKHCTMYIQLISNTYIILDREHKLITRHRSLSKALQQALLKHMIFKNNPNNYDNENITP